MKEVAKSEQRPGQAELMAMLDGGWSSEPHPDNEPEVEEAQVLASAPVVSDLSLDEPVVPTDLDELDEGDARYLCRGSRMFMHTVQIQGPIPKTGEVDVDVAPNPDDTVMRPPTPDLVAQSVPGRPPPLPQATVIVEKSNLLDRATWEVSQVRQAFRGVHLCFPEDLKPAMLRLHYSPVAKMFVLAVPRMVERLRNVKMFMVLKIMDSGDDSEGRLTLIEKVGSQAHQLFFSKIDSPLWMVRYDPLKGSDSAWLADLNWPLVSFEDGHKALRRPDQPDLATAQVRTRKDRVPDAVTPAIEPVLPPEPVVAGVGEEVNAVHQNIYPGFVPTGTFVRPQVVPGPNQVKVSNRMLLFVVVSVAVASVVALLAYLRVNDGIPSSPPPPAQVDCYNDPGVVDLRKCLMDRDKK
jgi:hypothetical protein